MSFWGHDSVATIDADRAAQEAEQGAQLVDVGEPTDWFAGHLPHALLVEPENADLDFAKLSKDKPVIVAYPESRHRAREWPPRCTSTASTSP